MLRDVLAWAFRRADATPEFTPETCLVHHGARCTACADACPHDAIRITRTVVIDEIDCTGCGLCVAACPTHALAPRGANPIARDVRCSRVAGDAASVPCLARLEASDLVRMGANAERVTLGRGPCGDCDVGGPEVPERIAETIASAAALLAVHGRPLDVDVVETERLDPSVDPRALSRRDLLRSGWSQVKLAGGAVMAPLERLAPEAPRDDGRVALPTEHLRRLRALEVADLDAAATVPWPLPVVADGCIFCPACTRVCPTDAIRRVFDEAPDGGPTGGVGGVRGAQGAMRIELEPDRCVGCDACVDVCPVHVVSMRPTTTWGDLTAGTRTVASSADRPSGEAGVVPRGPS
ncbi:MAG: 4Fe-4S binding protein [Trueperaceae bacterium]|nr:4Fe-4S binding protein [Trueperaceae bacterium]